MRCGSFGKLGGVLLVGGLSLMGCPGCGTSSPAALHSSGASAVAPVTPAPQTAVQEPVTQAAPPQQLAMATPPANAGVPVRATQEEIKPLHPTELQSHHERLTTEQVAMWASQGMRDDIIIDRIERAQTIFRLSAAEEQSLRQQGVSEDVIFALKESTRR